MALNGCLGPGGSVRFGLKIELWGTSVGRVRGSPVAVPRRNMAPATQRVYTFAVANFVRYHRKSPDQLGLEDIRDYRLAEGGAGFVDCIFDQPAKTSPWK
jgi:hypothetical protein